MVVGFRCDVISCELARRGVERDTAEASSSGGVRRVWAFLDHVSFFLVTLIVYFCVYHYARRAGPSATGDICYSSSYRPHAVVKTKYCCGPESANRRSEHLSSGVLAVDNL